MSILSKDEILTSIKGDNSVANLQKMTGKNINLDLVNINAYTNLMKFCPFVLKILNQNESQTSINSVKNSQNDL